MIKAPFMLFGTLLMHGMCQMTLTTSSVTNRGVIVKIVDGQRSVFMADRDINVESVKVKESALMVDVNLIAKTAKAVKSVNIIERDMIVKSAVEKASVLMVNKNLSVKIVGGRRSVNTVDGSQYVKNASEPILYFS